MLDLALAQSDDQSYSFRSTTFTFIPPGFKHEQCSLLDFRQLFNDLSIRLAPMWTLFYFFHYSGCLYTSRSRFQISRFVQLCSLYFPPFIVVVPCYIHCMSLHCRVMHIYHLSVTAATLLTRVGQEGEDAMIRQEVSSELREACVMRLD
jgi:hypothetical protein